MGILNKATIDKLNQRKAAATAAKQAAMAELQAIDNVERAAADVAACQRAGEAAVAVAVGEHSRRVEVSRANLDTALTQLAAVRAKGLR